MEQERQEQILNSIDETLERYHDERQMSVEDTMISGLKEAVVRKMITQEEMDEYLHVYIANRNSGIIEE